MQPILDRVVPSSRVRYGRFSLPVLALGLCALIFPAQQAALGQAQMGSAETCFDEGPDKLPVVPHASVPSLRAAMPAQIAQILQPLRSRPAAARPSHPVSQNSGAKDSKAPRKKPPEGTLTAAR